MILLILGHLVGDYVLQWNTLAQKKSFRCKRKEGIIYLILHSFIYAVAIGIFSLALFGWKMALIIAGILFVAHFVIDGIKKEIDNHINERKQIFTYVADQTIHIAIVVLIYYAFKNVSYTDEYLLKPLAADITFKQIATLLSGIIICWHPTSFLVDKALIALNPAEKKGTEDKMSAEKVVAEQTKSYQVSVTKTSNATDALYSVDIEAKENADVEHAKSQDKYGKWIGIAEREIILLLGLTGQYSAIGFVLTAKSVARFEQLKEKRFAEKYLIGTLVSTLVAIGLSLLIKTYLVR